MVFFAQLCPAADYISENEYIDLSGVSDQFGVTISFSVRYLLYGPGKTESEAIVSYLSTNASFCTKNGVLFLMDIQAIPGMIVKLFVNPSMKKYPFPVFPDTKGIIAPRIPVRSEHVTLVQLADTKTENISFIALSDITEQFKKIQQNTQQTK